MMVSKTPNLGMVSRLVGYCSEMIISTCFSYNAKYVFRWSNFLIWGWIVTFALTMIVAFSMAEICAAYPSAGSVYHWAGQVVAVNGLL